MKPSSGPAEQPHTSDVVSSAVASLIAAEFPSGPPPELIRTTQDALWYPFQSAEVRSICRHMTPEETRRLTRFTWRAGLIGGTIPSLILYPILMYLAFCTPLYPPRPWSVLLLLVLALPTALPVMWFGMARLRRKQVEMLCATEYAKAAGLTPDTLPLHERLLDRRHARPRLRWIVALMIVPLTLSVTFIAAGSFIPGVSGFWQSQWDDIQSRMVLYRMTQTYAGCRSYQDSGTVQIRTEEGPRQFNSEIQFTTAFVRDDRLRFEFRHLAGRAQPYRYIIWGDGRDIQTWWDIKPGVQQGKSLNLALAGASGIAAGSATTVPALLLPWQISPNIATTISEARLESDDVIDGHPCRRVQGKYAGQPITLWIDKQQSLLRRIELRMHINNRTTIQTTSYKPQMDIDVSAKDLEFAPPH